MSRALIFIARDYSLWVWRAIWDLKPEITFVVAERRHIGDDYVDSKIVERGVFGPFFDFMKEMSENLGLMPNMAWTSLQEGTLSEFLTVLEVLCTCLSGSFDVYLDITETSLEKKLYAYFFAIMHSKIVREVYYYDKEIKKRVVLPLSWPTKIERDILRIVGSGSGRPRKIYEEYKKRHKEVSMAFVSKYLSKMVKAGFLLRRNGEYRLTRLGKVFIGSDSTRKHIIELLDATVGDDRIRRNCYNHE